MKVGIGRDRLNKGANRMKVKEFKDLAEKSAGQTTNVRIYQDWGNCGVARVPDDVAKKIPAIIALLQANIHKGLLCNKEEQYLLIYNFQPLGQHYYSLDILLKPKEKIEETDKLLGGTTLQLVVNGHTGEVINNAKAWSEIIKIETGEDENYGDASKEAHISYGNYNHYDVGAETKAQAEKKQSIAETHDTEPSLAEMLKHAQQAFMFIVSGTISGSEFQSSCELLLQSYNAKAASASSYSPPSPPPPPDKSLETTQCYC